MNYASKAYAKIAKEIAAPRELEASLLLQAAAKLQAVRDSWKHKPEGLSDALMYNRRLWTVFLNSLIKDDGRLPAPLHENLRDSRRIRHVRDVFADDQAETEASGISHQDQSPDCCRTERSPLAAATGKPLPRKVFGQVYPQAHDLQ